MFIRKVVRETELQIYHYISITTRYVKNHNPGNSLHYLKESAFTLLVDVKDLITRARIDKRFINETAIENNIVKQLEQRYSAV